MKSLYKIILLLLAVLLVAACSRKKNTFLSRNYHAVTGEYNALYNGNNAFQAGTEQLAFTYRDNFWEILPVERINLDESQAPLPGDEGNQNFARAEEKAAKSIQKHSMYIDGKEYNPQTDEAYMLLGKARYYEQRFVPALDAFNFILNRYPTSNNINNAKIWKAKANIRLNNEDVALENLQTILDQEREDIRDEDLAGVTAIMAQAYIKLDSFEQAIPFMKMASEYVKDNELKGRYAYIKGQLYNKVGYKDSANMAFDEVIELNRKSPRVYMINAYIAKANNFDYQDGDRTALLTLLKELEEDRENRPYLDKIYNQIGEYYRNSDSVDTAIGYYNKSIKAFNNDGILQGRNYTTLAEINFDRALYKNAGAYYDSTLTLLDPISREYRRVKKKRENLDDVIKYETIAVENDSILNIANMSEAEQLTYFTAYVDKLKEERRKDSIANITNETTIANNEFFQKNGGGSNAQPGGTFYFYNVTTLSYGKQEFQKRWGDRRLEDNWRRSRKQDGSSIDEGETAVVEDATVGDRFNPQAYLSSVPTDQKILDSLTTDRNFAYYQLGTIYKEKFKEYDVAVDRFEKLLTYNPEDRLILPTKYNLFKIYELQENDGLATKYKNDIISNHADSRYAEILLNPDKLLASDESSPEFKYKELYREFEASNYQKVIDKSEDYIVAYTGDKIIAKFEMLKATAIGRQQGYEAYKAALNNVALDYPNTEEGKQAQNIYSTVLPRLATTDFIADDAAENWKLVYSFNAEDRAAADELKLKLDGAIETFRYTDYKTSLDYYNPSTVFVIVHGFNTKLGARNFAENLRDNKSKEFKEFRIKKTFIPIASDNYQTIQLHKNFDAYINNDTE